MPQIKLHGQYITVRGSNRSDKYAQLDDIDWLYAQLQTKSMAQVADELGIPKESRNVIRHRVEKYFPEEWKRSVDPDTGVGMVRERKRHKKSKQQGRMSNS